MRVIPVIDLMGGQVVRGIAGRRDEYRPIQSRIATDSQPGTVARAFVEQFGFDMVYVADLDAIMHGRPDPQAWSEIAASGLKLWLDAGVGTVHAARAVIHQIIIHELHLSGRDVRLVIGLESLESEQDFFSINDMYGYLPPIFSLDLKEGKPIAKNPAWQGLTPLEIALLAESMNALELIILDLADVGMNSGPRTIEFCRQIVGIRGAPDLFAGGGVRGISDLRALASAGCQGALVASALHDGGLSPAKIELAKTF